MPVKNGGVVIVGGGVVGLSVAYFLGRAGVASTVLERDTIGSHASGFALGGLSPVTGSGVDPVLEAMAFDGMRIHAELGAELPAETGLDTEYGHKPLLTLAFDEAEVRAGVAAVERQQQYDGYSVRWLEQREARAIEPRISDDALGGVHVEGSARVDPYRFSLALAAAAERLGVSIRKGEVTGLEQQSGRVTGVSVGGETLPCEQVVIASGPWSVDASEWLGFRLHVGPLKGQILRLRVPGPPLECTVGWNGNYATSKPDGLLWAGTTEEEVGFDETPTEEARDLILASLDRLLPSLGDVDLVRQTACLRPVTPDRLPLLGHAPGVEGVFVATGAERKGILFGPSMGRITADILTTGASDIPTAAFAPARFG